MQLSAPEVTRLTTHLTGTAMGRLATTEKTVARFRRAFVEKLGERPETIRTILNAYSFNDAMELLNASMVIGNEKETDVTIGNETQQAETDVETGQPSGDETEAHNPRGFEANEYSAQRARHAADRAAFESAEAEVPAKPKRARKAKDAAEPKAPREKKADAVLVLLRRPEGASAAEISEALNWQPHTIRAFIAVGIKKKLGLDVATAKEEGRGTVYRVAPVAAEAPAEPEAVA